MKRNIILIILAAVIVAALAGVMIFVLSLPKTEEVGLSANDTDILIYDKTSVKAEEITVKNSGGEYTLIGFDYTGMADEASQENAAEASEDSQPSGNKRTDETSTLKMNMRYTMQGLDDFELNKDNTDSLAYQCSYVTALQIVDKSGVRFSDFGLDKPLSTVKIRFSDGSEETLILGKKAPNDMGYYFRRELTDNVYLMNPETIGSFLIEKLQMLDRTLTKNFSEDEDNPPTISTISISGEGYKDPLKIDTEEDISIAATYKLRSPYHLACGKESAVSFGKMLYGIRGDEVIAAPVTDEAKKKYGLDKPFMIINVTATDDTKVGLLVSKAEKDGSCYVMADDGNIICKMTKEDMEGWYNITYTDFLTVSFIYPNMDNLDKAVITADGKTTQYDVTHTKDQNELLQDFSINSVKVNGKEVPYSNFNRYINNFTGLAREGTEVKDPGSYTQVYKAELTYSDNGSSPITDTLVMKKGADGAYIVYLNDMLMGYTDREYAEQLIAQTAVIDSEETLESLLGDKPDENVESSAESSADTSVQSSAESSADMAIGE